ncbi:MAG: LytTR family DNA-binding domain-containing protein [Ignavibacteriales bacterium]|jgi:Response regulator of the LytR/AlgR family|nr:MAG: response regulator transcription factor [Ignavibacteriaceae bacterium]MBW7873465.1 response regulator transcription factor [Ignavibacteria bacterium]MCZ2142156.1 LytTR family DNA-binding domain-containing protein [Ignavibacteriales bacterium]OQY70157.1 MAG: hypothetical protein B6D45_11655 [Ignavibacteriales bacterium UTCHB3]MBV6444891.1 Sensory transduction protein LytR [Ignavibacteriaceae bacterium]
MKCLIVDDEDISRKILEKFIEQTPPLKEVASCSSAVDAIEVLGNEEVDLIFLDIEMPEMNGIEMIEAVKKMPQIIFVTVSQNYALTAFEHNVTDYLLKPFTYERFRTAVDKAVEIHLTRSEPDLSEHVFVKVDTKLLKLNFSDIDFIEASRDYMQLHTAQGKYLIYTTMKSLENKLPQKKFVRVHRSFIVQIDRIKDITAHNLLINNRIIPIGDKYRNQLLRKLNIL